MVAPMLRPMFPGWASEVTLRFPEHHTAVSEGPYAHVRYTASAHRTTVSLVIGSPASTIVLIEGTSLGKRRLATVGTTRSVFAFSALMAPSRLFRRSYSEGTQIQPPCASVVKNSPIERSN